MKNKGSQQKKDLEHALEIGWGLSADKRAALIKKLAEAA